MISSKNNNVLSSVLMLMSGTALSQAIPILISPILTRLFSSSQFGELALFMSIVNVCAAVSNGKYSSSILLPKKKQEINDLIFLNILIAFLFSGILFLLLYTNSQFDLISVSLKNSFLLVIPVVVFIVSLQQIFMNLANKFEKYKPLALTKATQSITSSTSNISMGYLNYGSFGLIFSIALGYLVSTVFLINKIDFTLNWKKVEKSSLIFLAKRYKNFPLFTMPQSLMYQLVVQVPVFFIQDVYSISILGLYSLSYRVLTLPSIIISTSIGQVYYKQAADAFTNNQKEKLYSLTRSLILKIFVISTLVAISVYSFLPNLFALFFGEQWRDSGVIAQYLLIYLVPAFSISPFTQLYLASNNNRFLFLMEALRFALLLVLVFVGNYINISLNNFFLYFALIHTFCYMIIVAPMLIKKSFIWR